MGQRFFRVLNTPFYIVAFFCYVYFIIRNINHFNTLNSLQIDTIIEEWSIRFTQKYGYLAVHISCLTWILITLSFTL